MSIPAGPYPADINYDDVQIGMLVRGSATWAGQNGINSVLAMTSRVAGKDDASISLAVEGWALVRDPNASLGSISNTLELMEEFTGDPNEPAEGSVIVTSDGAVYQRTDTGDPMDSVWHAANSTAAASWLDLTSTGDAAVLGGQS